VRRGWIRFALTEKRLFRTPSYLLVLLALPLIMLGMRFFSSEEKGMLTIALYAEEPVDDLAQEVIEKIVSEEELLYCIVCDSREEAEEMVTGGKADAAWILDADLREKIASAAEGRAILPVARILVREDNVLHQFSREVLAGQLFPEFLYDVYREVVLHDLEIDLTEEELRSIYERRLVDGNLFEGEYLDGEAVGGSDYLLNPLRGLMAVWLVISGFAAVLYHVRDEQRGAFEHLPYLKRDAQALYLMAVVLFNGGIAYYAGCLILNVLTDPLREALRLVLFLFCSAVFCLVLGKLLRKVQYVGAMIPAMIILLLTFSPVFFDIKDFWMLQTLLPTYLYLNSVHSSFYAAAMAVYMLAGAAVWGILCTVHARRFPCR
jgi:ABC-2 type transport system permease protein